MLIPCRVKSNGTWATMEMNNRCTQDLLFIYSLHLFQHSEDWRHCPTTFKNTSTHSGLYLIGFRGHFTDTPAERKWRNQPSNEGLMLYEPKQRKKTLKIYFSHIFRINPSVLLLNLTWIHWWIESVGRTCDFISSVHRAIRSGRCCVSFEGHISQGCEQRKMSLCLWEWVSGVKADRPKFHIKDASNECKGPLVQHSILDRYVSTTPDRTESGFLNWCCFRCWFKKRTHTLTKFNRV